MRWGLSSVNTVIAAARGIDGVLIEQLVPSGLAYVVQNVEISVVRLCSEFSKCPSHTLPGMIPNRIN